MKTWLLGLLFAIFSSVASAHEMRPSVASLSVDSQGTLTLELVTNMEAWIANIDPSLSDTDDSPNAGHYDQLRALGTNALVEAIKKGDREITQAIEILAGGGRVGMSLIAIEVLPVDDINLPRDTRLTLGGGLPDGVSSLVYRVHETLPNTAVRLFLENADPVVQFVRSGRSSDALSLDQAVQRSVGALVAEYLVLGFTHIIPKGLDHIIFILGLALISKRFIDLLIQVTAFTVAHSVTLALGLYGVLRLPASVVEPLIAASIVYIAVENIWHHRVNISRTLIVFCFGLLHGLGFAGVLTELGLPERDFLVGLLAFNGGVEIGQLSVILVAYLSVGIWAIRFPWYRERVAVPISAIIGLVGVYWFVERVAG